METAIRVQGISKGFDHEQGHRPILKLMASWADGKPGRPDNFYALKDVSFSIQSGVKTALIGNNGAGKSTLLKILAGLYRQSSGTVEVKGKILYLPGLSIGMHPQLTVTENIILHSAIYGISRTASTQNIQDILAWAELERFADLEFRKLSKGMQARLAFSTCRHITADIHLLDEALSSGDQNFKAKCDRYFEQQSTTDRTYLVATHSLKFAQSFCTDAIFLHKGRLIGCGPTEEILEQYEKFNERKASAEP
jgi:ABC-type polysaccharide/polyol phosphate transport system ATPase subunit